MYNISSSANCVLFMRRKEASLGRTVEYADISGQHMAFYAYVLDSKAPFTLRSIFGTARIKLVPVPLFWFLDYLYGTKNQA
jgi:hypothetical protein